MQMSSKVAALRFKHECNFKILFEMNYLIFTQIHTLITYLKHIFEFVFKLTVQIKFFFYFSLSMLYVAINS